jgi:hypothetical protein
MAGDSGRVVESGTFVLHKFEQAVGTERYVVRQRGDTLVMSTDFKFTDPGTEVPLTASFRARRDLTPLAFEIKGSSARGVEVDASVVVDGTAARVREGSRRADRGPPAGGCFDYAAASIVAGSLERDRGLLLIQRSASPRVLELSGRRYGARSLVA